jgi:uncharacterized protein (TIGR03083 family)
MGTLSGALVRLRAATHADIPALSEIRSTPEVHARWGGGEDMTAAIAEEIADPDTEVLVIVYEGRVVGALQWSEEEDPDYRHAGIDIYLDPSVHRRGLGADSVRTIARHLFEDLGHHRLVIDPAADNHAAIRCYAKVGFRPVGVMRKYERGPDGAWHDGLLMDLLAGELTYGKADPMTELNPDRARRAIVEHTRRLAESAAAAGPAVVVPTAPAWTVADLVEHVGQTQHWVAEIIERRITDPTRLPTEMAVLPADPGEWPAWLSESARRVASACSEDALDAPVFNPAADGRTGTRFWMTSMLNESVVHGFDAATAAGRPADIDAGIAAALVSNHFAMLTSPTWAMMRSDSADAVRGSGQTLQWRATDTADAWLVERRPDGPTWQPGTRPADVTVTGPARSLLLTLTRRLPLTGTAELTVDGDTDLAQHWLDHTAHVSG